MQESQLVLFVFSSSKDFLLQKLSDGTGGSTWPSPLTGPCSSLALGLADTLCPSSLWILDLPDAPVFGGALEPELASGQQATGTTGESGAIQSSWLMFPRVACNTLGDAQ